MKTKLTQAIPLASLLVVLVAIHFLYQCADTLTCSLRGTIWSTTFTLLDPTLVWVQWAVLPSILFIFVRRSTFNSWLKFAAWAIPVCIIIIALTPVNSNAYIDFFSFFRDDAARLTGELFAGISFILIIWKSAVLRRKVETS